jgi:DsbC/DsbD-like thiol-disulfide interchange protein
MLPIPVRLTEMCECRYFRRAVLAAFFLGAGFETAPATATDAVISSWSKGQKSVARLVASGGLEGGVYHVGVEIKLDPGTLTYWRTPGDAGVPPVFAFAGSSNLARAQVLFPAPTRYVEDGAQTFGYKGDVTFPVDVTPRDRQSPVNLVLDLHYATCDQICLPAEAKIGVTLTPQAKAGPEAARIAAANSRVPEIVDGAGGHSVKVEPLAAASAPTWTIAFSPVPSASADLFAEGPDGYFFDTHRNGGFQITLAQAPPDAKGPVPVTLTLVDGAAAYQSTIRLDAAPAAP